MKKKLRLKNQKAARVRSALPGSCLMGAALLVGLSAASAADEPDNSIFEGGTNTFNNWVEISAGGLISSGNRSQAEQARRLPERAFGGIEDMHLQYVVGTNTTFTVDGRGIYDNDDYNLSLGLKKEEAWFLRFNAQNSRTWYNGDGGYYPPGSVWYPLADRALGLDRGEVSVEAGLSLKNKPAVTFRYAHQYRDGDKSSTIWGQSHPGFTSLVRGLVPTVNRIDEARDIFELDVTHRIKKTDFGVGLRYETGDLNNKRYLSQWPGEPAVERKITNREGTSYDAFNVHAFSETWLKKNLFFSTGFLFANLDNDFSGSRIYGSDFDVSYAPNALNGTGYNDLGGGSHKQEYVLNLNLMALPTKHLTIVPSVRVQKEDWNADFATLSTSGTTTPGFLAGNTDGDSLDVRERLDIRYTGITNWVLYAQGEWTQGEGNVAENGLGSPIQRATEDSRFFQKYSAGARWYATRRMSLDVGGYYKLNAYDYDHTLDNTPNAAGGNRYPAFLVMQDFETYDGNARLTLRPLNNLTLVSRYEYQLSTIHTQPDATSGLSDVESSEMRSHIFAQNISWAPWSRLYLQTGFNYVVSKTETPTSDFTQAVLDSQNNYWTLNFNSGLVLDNKTDLNLGYTYFRADDYTDNSTVGLPFGAGMEEHGVTATVVRRINEHLRVTVRYGFYHSEDEPSGGNKDYDAHVLFASAQYRF